MTLTLVPDQKPDDLTTIMESTLIDLDQYLDLLFEAVCGLSNSTHEERLVASMQMAMSDRVKLARQSLKEFQQTARRQAS